jgi:predicted DNA-binding protein
MTKRKALPQIKIYVTDVQGRKLQQRLQKISEQTGLSVSKLSRLAIVKGLSDVEKRLRYLSHVERSQKVKP